MNLIKKLINAIAFILRVENELSHIKQDVAGLKANVNELRESLERVEERIDKLYDIIINKLIK